MTTTLRSVGLVAMTAWASAQALVIDEATFQRHDGNMTSIASSLETRNEELRAASYQAPWLVVGKVGGCTATWLGDKEGWSYVLTAAHCVKYKGVATATAATFTAPGGRVIASGRGIAHVPPQRVKIPKGMGGASTDVAILKLPTHSAMVDKNGKPLEPPVLNDQLDELGRDVIFVGYGSWGVGLDGSGAYKPAQGERRLYGRSRIDSIFELEHGIAASYKPVGPSPFWARLAPGDSGSAWWQLRDDKAVIIATTNGGRSVESTGARISKHIGWIRSVYPEARLSSAEKPRGCIVSLRTSARYCLSADQEAEYSLPPWIYEHDVYVDAAPGTAVQLSDFDNLSYHRIATFVGTVDNGRLKSVRAANGVLLDFSRPHSMRVVSNTTAVGCITSLLSGARYCLPPGQRSGYSLPAWIYAHDVQVHAAPGTAVMLSDVENLAYHRFASFTGFVQNWELTKVRARNGKHVDFSRPRSMRVIQQ
ncbi:peptidase S1 and S6, chymotrypsin/Hap [Metarhizium album ARSEF 1941]|uniref:Peptidase S1 and S6, chymotrypsin/Hap n=1 Tax=Metarhizium album (strain ARSEF 1941) TaxID=1081103 RepID=A0A0B2X0M1_METAS|nr:peptidase S1 and S6, chymotrypsin/Hap [Metarhizium album ARSEF 1941]KHN99833.1 peptidase S1 and S6, chymotrypsin/Hap [Metarhizium album ARSEF 1941]